MESGVCDTRAMGSDALIEQSNRRKYTPELVKSQPEACQTGMSL